MVGAGLESGCWMVGEMVGDKVVVEWRLVVSVSVLGNGCVVVELALWLPKGGRMSVRPWAAQGRVAPRYATLKREANELPPAYGGILV